MAARNQVELEIRARNEASGALDRAFHDMERSRTGAREFARAFGDLNPILSETVFRISGVAQATRGVDVGLRTAVIGVGLLAVGFVAYTRALEQSITAQVAFNAALRSADVGALRSQLTGLNTELDTMAAKLAKLGANEGFGQAFRNVVGLITTAPTALLELLGFRMTPEERQRQLTGALTPLLQIQGARESAESRAKLLGASLQGLTAEQQRELAFGTTAGFIGRGIGIETTAAAQLQQQLEALRIKEQEELAKAFGAGVATGPQADLIRRQYEGQRALLRRQAENARRTRAITQEQLLSERGLAGLGVGVAEFEGFEGAFFGGDTSDIVMRRQQIQHRQEVQAIEDLRREMAIDIAPFEGFEGAFFGGLTPEDRRLGMRRARGGREESVGLDAERLSIARDRLALTREERASFDLILIQQQRQLELEAAIGDERKEALADFRAQAETAAKLREEFERTDFLGGMAKGLREVREGLTSFGETGADVVRRFATTAERAMSDLFFLPIERGWKKTFEELPRQVGLSALRILTDTFARLTLGSLLRGAGLGGVAGAVGVPGLSLPGLGVGTAQAGALNVTGRSATELAQLQGAGYQLATNQAGQTFAIPTPPLSSVQGYAPGGIQQFLNTPVWGSTGTAAAYTAAGLTPMVGPGGELLFTTASGTVLSEASATALMATTAEQGSTTAVATTGATYGQYLGYAGMVVAAGFAAYSAYQSGSPAQGALTGAMTGLMIGAYFGPIGAVVGLVAGAAIGAGLGALGKKSPTHAQREAREIGRAAGAVQADIARIQAAQTPEDLVAAIRGAMHEAYGGPPGRGTSPSNAGFAIDIAGRSVRFGGPYGATMTEPEFLALLVAQPETFKAGIQLGVSEGAKADMNRALEENVRAKVSQLLGDFSRVLFGFDEALQVPGLGGGVTRTTILPASRAADARGRGPLSVLGDSFLGLDDETKAKILMELARVNDQMDLQILRVEESGVRVTVGRWTPTPSS